MRLSLLGLVLFPALIACGTPSADDDASQSNAVQGGKSDRNKGNNFAVGIASRYGAVCSGTLIAPNLVLTARHCVVPPDGKESVTCADSFPAKNASPSMIFVTTEPSLRNARKLYRAKEITTPSERGFCGNDIALITLAENIPAKEATPATPVVQFSMTDRSKITGEITALGYGISSPMASDSGVRRIRQGIAIRCVPGDDSYECKGSYKSMVDSDKEFVTEGYVCSGDSGGGAFDQESFTSGTPYVLGALSRGPQTNERCLAAIYTRTDAHAEMILETAEKAAAAGDYPPPAWLLPPESDELGDPACEGDDCAFQEESGGGRITTTTRTTFGCATTSARSSSGAFAVVALAAAAVLRRRRRAN